MSRSESSGGTARARTCVRAGGPWKRNGPAASISAAATQRTQQTQQELLIGAGMRGGFLLPTESPSCGASVLMIEVRDEVCGRQPRSQSSQAACKSAPTRSD